MADADRAMKHEQKVRWLRNGEFEALVQMDRAIFDHPWHHNTTDEIVNARTNLCVVAEGNDGSLVGFLIFEAKADRFYVLKMGVLAEHRRSGTGDRLLNFVADRLKGGRNKIEIDVREKLALDAHAFYSSYGFKATGVRQEFFKVYDIMCDEPSHVEDSYNFVFEAVFEMPMVPLPSEFREPVEAAIQDSVREFL